MKKTLTRFIALNITLVMLLTMLVPAVSALELFPVNDPGLVKAEEGAGYYKVTIEHDKDFDLYSLFTLEFCFASFETIATRTNYLDNDIMVPIEEGIENGRRYAIYELAGESEAGILPYDSSELLADFKNDMYNRYPGDRTYWKFSIDDSFTGLNYRCTEKVYSVEKVEDKDSWENPFVDVKEGTFYYDPVLWAVHEGITTGTSATTFSPNKSCTRAEVVTFLWRAKGKPAPMSSVNPFKDVKAGQWYTDAVLWAVGEGITNGTSATTFSPDKVCTRAEVVTFLMRAVEAKDTNSSRSKANDIPIEIGSLKAYATGYGIVDTQYTPEFSSVTAYDQDGNALPDTVETFGFYTKSNLGSDAKLTTAPEIGKTYYSSFTIDLDNIGGWDFDAEDIDIRIPGFRCKFNYAMEREMGSYMELNYTATAAPLFNDVAVDKYYYEPVLWAASEGITTGTGEGVFSPDNYCDRGQIVTFLYRALTNS